jgi:prolyl oligopeptidase
VKRSSRLAAATLGLGLLAACVADPPPAAAPLPSPSSAGPAAAPRSAAFAYPAARVVDASDTFHGTVVRDPYRWLEDEKAPDVRAWVTAEDELARAAAAKLPERAAFATRFTELRYIDALGVPTVKSARTFQKRRAGEMEKAAVFVRDGKAPLRPLLDPNTWPAQPPSSLQDWFPSHDGRRIAYDRAPNNADDTILEVMDVTTGKIEEELPGLLGADVHWSAKDDAFYYNWSPPDPKLSEAERFSRTEVRRHVLGKKFDADTIVRPAVGRAGDYEDVDESRDGRWLLVHRERGPARQSVYLRRADRPADPWIALAEGETKANAVVWKGVVYLVTNEGAPRFRLVKVDAAKAATHAFDPLVPERADATLHSATVVGNHLVLVWMVDAAHRLEVRDLDGKNAREIALPGIASIEALDGREDQPLAHLVVSSIARPPEVWTLDVDSGAMTLEERPKAAVDPAAYVIDEIFARSKDGTRVPAFVARRRETPRDGARPTVIDGYGGFAISRIPKFDANAVAWMDRGGVWVSAILRGGGEYGEAWHRAGMRVAKQNVFDDYFAVAEQAVSEGWTKPGRLAAHGRSNGGLLVGAAVTQRPDLWGAAMSGVPLLDMIRMRLTGNGASWVDEYGSPDDPAELAALLGYSPYHRIVPKRVYPPLLVASSDADARVDPMHARKFVARLQAEGAGGPFLVEVESAAGHAGADGVKRAIERFADQFAFLWHYTSEGK